jgi:hypothetical protein
MRILGTKPVEANPQLEGGYNIASQELLQPRKGWVPRKLALVRLLSQLLHFCV